MFITLFKHKRGCQRGSCSVAVLVLSMAGCFVTPAGAEQVCATDFFSQKTCRSFDALDPGIGQGSDAQEYAAGTALWSGHPGLSGSQIWYRNPVGNNWMSMALGGRESSGNLAIHGFRCVTDLFGNVVCNRNQFTLEVSQDQKSPSQR